VKAAFSHALFTFSAELISVFVFVFASLFLLAEANVVVLVL
jgi:hypothetical protein